MLTMVIVMARKLWMIEEEASTIVVVAVIVTATVRSILKMIVEVEVVVLHT